jgi:hypothetical protein
MDKKELNKAVEYITRLVDVVDEITHIKEDKKLSAV